jgi:excisionase family DNA binding protein
MGMAHRQTVTVVGRCKIGKDWARYPAVYAEGTHRVEAGVFLIDGKPQKVSDYVYQLRYYQGSRTKYVTVGRFARNAEAERKKLESDLRTHAHAVSSTAPQSRHGEKRRSAQSTRSVNTRAGTDLCARPELKNGSIESSRKDGWVPLDTPTKIEQMDHLLTVKELATILNISRSNLYVLCKSKGTPYITLGGAIRFDPVTLASWLRGKSIKDI